MSFRTKSAKAQNRIRLFLVLAAIAAYLICVNAFGDGTGYFALLRPDRMRYVLPIVVVFVFLAYETRREEETSAGENADAEDAAISTNTPQENATPVPESAPALKLAAAPETKSLAAPAPADAAGKAVSSKPPQEDPTPDPESLRPEGPGAKEYAEARKITHSHIPDPERASDTPYLKLLFESAKLGYPLALAKLGDYALRRDALVEAYYWLWQAQANGVANLGSTLTNIRRNWKHQGMHQERWNIHDYFTYEDNQVARALLDLSSPQYFAQAKSFLKAARPNLVPQNFGAS